MASNLIQIKRTSVSGRAANNTTLQNPGELALNMADGILYSTNGSSVFEIGANNTNAKVSNTLTIYKLSANGSLGTNGQFLVSNGLGTYWTSSVDGLTSLTSTNGYFQTLYVNNALYINSALYANNSLGTNNYVLRTSADGTAPYWGLATPTGYDPTSIIFSNTTPLTSSQTLFWYHTEKGLLYVDYLNPATNQLVWVSTSSQTPTQSFLAAGANQQVQFNKSTQFAGNANFVFNETTSTLSTNNITVSNNLQITTVVANNSAGANGSIFQSNGTVSFWSTSVSSLTFTGNVTFSNTSTIVTSNGAGSTGQVLKTDGQTVYWGDVVSGLPTFGKVLAMNYNLFLV